MARRIKMKRQVDRFSLIDGQNQLETDKRIRMRKQRVPQRPWRMIPQELESSFSRRIVPQTHNTRSLGPSLYAVVWSSSMLGKILPPRNRYASYSLESHFICFTGEKMFLCSSPTQLQFNVASVHRIHIFKLDHWLSSHRVRNTC